MISPQHVGWFLPFVPLLAWRRAVWMVNACALTAPIFPWLFLDPTGQRGIAVFVLIARNLALIAAALVLLNAVRTSAY